MLYVIHNLTYIGLHIVFQGLNSGPQTCVYKDCAELAELLLASTL